MIVAVIGLGLIGGSLALAMKAKGIATTVVGVEANAANAAKALELGIVSEVVSLAEAVERAELIVIAVPVDAIPQLAIKVLNKVTDRQIVHKRTYFRAGPQGKGQGSRDKSG